MALIEFIHDLLRIESTQQHIVKKNEKLTDAILKSSNEVHWTENLITHLQESAHTYLFCMYVIFYHDIYEQIIDSSRLLTV